MADDNIMQTAILEQLLQGRRNRSGFSGKNRTMIFFVTKQVKVAATIGNGRRRYALGGCANANMISIVQQFDL